MKKKRVFEFLVLMFFGYSGLRVNNIGRFNVICCFWFFYIVGGISKFKGVRVFVRSGFFRGVFYCGFSVGVILYCWFEWRWALY